MRFIFHLLFTIYSIHLIQAGLDNLFGIQVKDNVILSATRKEGMDVISLKDDVENIHEVGECLMGFSGHRVICDHLYEYLLLQNKKQELSVGRKLNTEDVLAHCRYCIKKYYRQIVMQNDREVLGVLIAGWESSVDEDTHQACAKTPALYWVNEFGEFKKVPYAAHGIFASSLFSYCDRVNMELVHENEKLYPNGWRSLSKEEALPKLENAWDIVQKRSNIVIDKVRTKWLQT